MDNQQARCKYVSTYFFLSCPFQFKIRFAKFYARTNLLHFQVDGTGSSQSWRTGLAYFMRNVYRFDVCTAYSIIPRVSMSHWWRFRVPIESTMSSMKWFFFSFALLPRQHTHTFIQWNSTREICNINSKHALNINVTPNHLLFRKSNNILWAIHVVRRYMTNTYSHNKRGIFNWVLKSQRLYWTILTHGSNVYVTWFTSEYNIMPANTPWLFFHNYLIPSFESVIIKWTQNYWEG